MSDRRTLQALRNLALPEAMIAVPTSHAVPRLADFGMGERRARISAKLLGFAVQGIEAVMAAAFIGATVSSVPGFVAQVGTWTPALWTLAAAALVSLGLRNLKLYTKAALLAPVSHLPRLGAGLAGAFVVLSVAEWMRPVGVSPGDMVLSLAVTFAGLAVMRLPLAGVVLKLARANRVSRRAVIYGTGEDCKSLITALEADATSDIRIAAVFDERGDGRVSDTIMGYPKRGTLDALISFSRSTRVDMVILALPMAAEPRVLGLLERLAVLPCDIRLASMSSKLRFSRRTYSYIGSVPLIDLADKPISGFGTWAKWALDVVVATAALIALSPVMAGVALAIKLTSKGPVIFKQKRYGFNNELIEVWKFRSMFVSQADVMALKLVTKNDPRVTPVGRFIRKTSIDELPQLFNVLFGTLSLVGPRPHALAAKAAGRQYDEVVARYFARHKVKPGITGWAQINGWRGETETVNQIENRVACDLHYIENWSLRLDSYILLMTPVALLDTSRAY